MAFKINRNAPSAVYVIIPAMLDENESPEGFVFKSASAADEFAEKLRKVAVKEYSKYLGLETVKDDKAHNDAVRAAIKALPKLGLECALQPVDAAGDATGEASLFKSYRK